MKQILHIQKDKTDFRLLTTRLEQEIISGKNPERVLKILGEKRIWEKLSPRDQIQWAALCRMAGDLESALQVYERLHQKCPEFFEAWQEHMELLHILDEREKSARVFSLARSSLSDKAQIKKLAGYTGTPKATENESGRLPPSGPFEQLRKRQDSIGCFMERFSGKEDAFARQWVNRDEGTQGYVPVRRSINAEDIEDHFRGKRTYGIYLVRDDNTVKAAAIDADLKSTFRNKKLKPDEKRQIVREKQYMITRIKHVSESAGLFPLVEFSGGKGLHFWYFFDPPAQASQVRSVLNRIEKLVSPDLSAFTLEVFPKQDRLSGKGFGNLVKLPLGVHRLTGKKSTFIEAGGLTLEHQLELLKKTPVTQTEHFMKADEKSRVIRHPRWQKWTESHPELATFEQHCPPLGMLTASCLNGYPLSIREQKVLYQTVGFLHNGHTLMHFLAANFPDYNPHQVDYSLSKLRGTPLGCKRIHSLLNYSGDFCRFENTGEYDHPLRHFAHWQPGVLSQKVDNLNRALENLKVAMIQVGRFMPLSQGK